MNRSLDTTNNSPYALIAQDSHAVESLLRNIDSLLMDRIDSLVNQCASTEQAAVLIESLVPYGRYVEVRKIVLLFKDNNALYSQEDISYGLSCLTHAVDTLLGEIDNILANSTRLQLLQEAMFAHKTPATQLKYYTHIAERRAYARAMVTKIQTELQTTDIPYTEKELLFNKLGMFSVLDTYPNTLDNEQQARELESTLDVLEPILDRLQIVLDHHNTRQASTNLYTDIVPKTTHTTTDSRLRVRSQDNRTAQKPVKKSPRQNDILPPTAPEPATRNSVHTSKPETGSNLGTYEIQRGDTLIDILSGQTAAGYFPILYKLNSQQRKNLIAVTRKYLNSNRVLLNYIGAEDTIDKIAHSGDSVTISLDALHDIVVYIAHEKNFIHVADATVQKFRKMLRANSTAHKENRDINTGEHIQNTVIHKLYEGDENLFLEDWLIWLQDMVDTNTSHTHLQAMLWLTHQQWKFLHNDSNKRYEWLRTQDMPLRIWNSWAEAIRDIYSRVPYEQKRDISVLTIADMSQFVFANQLYRTN